VCHVDLPTRKQGQTLTSKLDEQIKAESQYWRHVMERVIAVICTFAERGFFGSPDNGNYLGLLELLAKCDPFLLARINRYGNSEPGNPFYFVKSCM
jgi:hypothetical protein